MTDWTFKIIIVGDAYAGKTTLRRVYLGENLSQNYLATIGADFSHKLIKLDDEKAVCAIWDIAGQKKYEELSNTYFEGAQGIIVVYNVTDRSTLKSTIQWLQKINKINDLKNRPVMIIGNKTDILDPSSEDHISDIEHEKHLKSIKRKFPDIMLNSIRTSALRGINVDEAFASLIGQVITVSKNLQLGLTKETKTDVSLWDFSEKYIQVELIKCRNCSYYIEEDRNILHCPYCENILVAQNKISAFVRRRDL